jgi:hypothetical protein
VTERQKRRLFDLASSLALLAAAIAPVLLVAWMTHR